MSSLSTLPKGDSAWLLRKAIERIMQQVSVLETNIGSSTTGNSANTQIIFNDAGTLRGDAGLTYNKTTDLLSVGAATITGDLTVDTSTLKVDSANNRVGVATTTPGCRVDIVSDSNTSLAPVLRVNSNNVAVNTALAYDGLVASNILNLQSGTSQGIIFNTNAGTERYRIASDGVATWSNVGGVAGTAMTLNSTGLGVGRTPSYRFQASSGTKATTAAIATVGGITTTDADDFGIFFRIKTDATATNRYAAISSFDNGSGNGPRDLVLQDLGGNVGISVTPSAWAAGTKAFQVGNTAALWNLSSGLYLSNNRFYDGANKYIITGAATAYEQSSGSHVWLNAPSGTAGNAITFTQAMTLDASGNLLVGTTSNAPAGTQSQFVNEWSGGAKWGSTFNQTVSSATAYTHIAFCTNGTVRGSIDANNTTITYGTVSDYRLKENVQPISNALTRIAALKPSTYKWKDSGTDGEGFIAHELAAVVPLAVVGQKDAVNEDGSIKAQQIDLSKVVPILVAAIKELAAEVNALKNA
jgi:hypothetical protein